MCMHPENVGVLVSTTLSKVNPFNRTVSEAENFKTVSHQSSMLVPTFFGSSGICEN